MTKKQQKHSVFYSLTVALLKTQRKREYLVEKLQHRLEIAEKEAEKAEDPAVKAGVDSDNRLFNPDA